MNDKNYMNATKRARQWTIKTYKDINEIEKTIKGSKMRYYLILHDRDKNEDGSLKKQHVHCVFVFENARQGKGIAEWLGLEHNAFIEPIRDLRQMIRYLFHLDHNEKYLYDLKDLKTNDNLNYIKDKNFSELTTEEQKVNDAMQVYDNCLKYINGEITFKQLIREHPNFIYQMSSLHYLIKMITTDKTYHR